MSRAVILTRDCRRSRHGQSWRAMWAARRQLCGGLEPLTGTFLRHEYRRYAWGAYAGRQAGGRVRARTLRSTKKLWTLSAAEDGKG